MSALVNNQNMIQNGNVNGGGGYDLEIFVNPENASNYICAMYETISEFLLLPPKYHILIDI